MQHPEQKSKAETEAKEQGELCSRLAKADMPEYGSRKKMKLNDRLEPQRRRKET
jgi:hypothetical protein